MAEDDITSAQKAARLALLQHIARTAEEYTTPANIRDLAYAFALTVGASASKLPGGPVDRGAAS